MKIFILLAGIFLFIVSGLFAQAGRVVTDITYDELNGSSNVSQRLVTYYTDKALAFDTANARINEILMYKRINGVLATNIKVGPVQDSDGEYLATVTYDEDHGSSNLTYVVEADYDLKHKTKEALADQILAIQRDQKLFGIPIRNIKVSDIVESNGAWTAKISYDELNGASNQSYNFIDYFFDPKVIAKDLLMDAIDEIKLTNKIYGVSVKNVKYGDIQEVNGGYTVTVSYDETNGAADQKYMIGEFYDPKLKAYDDVFDHIQQMKITKMHDGVLVTNVKYGDIKENDGRYSAAITYDEVNGKSNLKATVTSFFDPVKRAVADMQKIIETIKIEQKIYGKPIRNLKIGKTQIM